MVALLVGTDDGVVAIDDGGAQATSLAGRSVQALAGDEHGWWAIVDHEEIWHWGAGAGWRLQAPAGGVRLRCLAPTPSGVLVGTAEAHLATLAGDRLHRVEGFDEVGGRSRWYTPWGGPPDTRSLAHDGGGTVYAGVHVGGIVASADEGRHWRATSLDIDADVHQVVAGFGGDGQAGVVLAACAEGLAVSADLGESWRIHADGLHATYSRAVAVAADTVVVSASTGPRTDRSALYRRSLAGTGPFQRCTNGLPTWFDQNIDTGCLAADGDTVAFAAGGGTVFVSTDAASSFSPAATGLPAVTCLALSEVTAEPEVRR